MRKLLLLLFVIFLRFEPSIAQVYGCTDLLATNYNSVATRNEGSCLYANITISPVKSTLISDTLNESSGLITGAAMLEDKRILMLLLAMKILQNNLWQITLKKFMYLIYRVCWLII